ncbi:MAG: dihydroorotate dehydrogenase [Planctomycetes bacterium]|nr:dihydroorotate dehydrogenase [Planctomycetota bacterium]
MLDVRLGPLHLKNPVISASGCFGQGAEAATFFDPRRLGALLLKTITLNPRAGNPPPRIVETAGGIINSIGLPNKGIDRYLAETFPEVVGLADCLILNVAGERLEEWPRLAACIGDRAGIDALELNVSCPNVEQGGLPFARDPEVVARIVRGVARETPLPLIVKLAPEAPDLPAVAQAAAEAGAIAVSLINTIRALAVDWRARRPLLGYGFGGLSGPAIKPVALRLVHEVARAVAIPVIGIGGIQDADDVLEFMVAGASAVQVGTASLRDPLAMPRIIDELPERLAEAGVAHVRDLVGTLRFPPAPPAPGRP